MRTDYSCNEMLINKGKVAELLQCAFTSFRHRKLIKMALLWLSFLLTIQIADRNSWTKFPMKAVYWLKLTPIDTQGKHPNLGSTLKNEIMLCFTYKWCSTMERRLQDRNSVPDAGRGEAGGGMNLTLNTSHAVDSDQVYVVPSRVEKHGTAVPRLTMGSRSNKRIVSWKCIYYTQPTKHQSLA